MEEGRGKREEGRGKREEVACKYISGNGVKGKRKAGTSVKRFPLGGA